MIFELFNAHPTANAKGVTAADRGDIVTLGNHQSEVCGLAFASQVAMNMENTTMPLERAFELAKSGQFSNVADIKKQLVKEHLSTEQVTGRTLLNQLRDLMQAALELKA